MCQFLFNCVVNYFYLLSYYFAFSIRSIVLHVLVPIQLFLWNFQSKHISLWYSTLWTLIKHLLSAIKKYQNIQYREFYGQTNKKFADILFNTRNMSCLDLNLSLYLFLPLNSCKLLSIPKKYIALLFTFHKERPRKRQI